MELIGLDESRVHDFGVLECFCGWDFGAGSASGRAWRVFLSGLPLSKWMKLWANTGLECP